MMERVAGISIGKDLVDKTWEAELFKLSSHQGLLLVRCNGEPVRRVEDNLSMLNGRLHLIALAIKNHDALKGLKILLATTPPEKKDTVSPIVSVDPRLREPTTLMDLTPEEMAIFKENMPYVQKLVYRHDLSRFNILSEELLSKAYEALIVAIRTYDATKKVKFTTWLTSIYDNMVRDIVEHEKPQATQEVRVEQFFKEVGEEDESPAGFEEMVKDLNQLKVDDHMVANNLLRHLKRNLKELDWLILKTKLEQSLNTPDTVVADILTKKLHLDGPNGVAIATRLGLKVPTEEERLQGKTPRVSDSVMSEAFRRIRNAVIKLEPTFKQNNAPQ